MRRFSCSLALLATAVLHAGAQDTTRFSHADTLRGSITAQRAWWDVVFYDLHVRINPADSSIAGYNGITYRVLRPATEMQIDLQVPLEVDSMVQDGAALAFRRDSNAFFVTLTAPQRTGTRKTVRVYYHGKPRTAVRAPWDGGFVWARDSLGNRWIATAVEGLGASAWWPNKDTRADEPDSQRVAITVPEPLVDVSNGRLRRLTREADGTTTYEFFVSSPINNYDIAVNAGSYAHFSDVYKGERGALTLDFWPLAYHLDTAKVQFQQVKPMLTCFERWFGPYPWYKDGYKLVETPHLGMEHQSAVAYGNRYKNGYSGRDLSATGHGLKWDFIIVHESAHEWWGNNITTSDPADMWVHESFANYSEALYTECQENKQAGADYVIGVRRLVRNDAPIIAHYGVNEEPPGDMYYKGGNMLHTIRQIVGNDAKWRSILRGLNATFWHQTVPGAAVEQYMSRRAGRKLGKVFDQYLRTTMIPVFEYKLEDTRLSYRWANVVLGFDMPIKVTLKDDTYSAIQPTAEWKTATVHLSSPSAFKVDRNYYVTAKDVLAPAPKPAPPP